MTELHLNHLDDDLFHSLEERAASHGCSVEDELNSLLRDALGKKVNQHTEELSPQTKIKNFQEMIDRYGVSVPNLSEEAFSRETIYGERG